MSSLNQKNITFRIQARHQTVTGSSFFCTLIFPNSKTFDFLVDAGLFQEKEFLFLNKKLDFQATKFENIFITHNHSDHIGALPFLVKNRFNGKIHTSNKTKTLLPISLFDSAKIESKNASIAKVSPLYTSDDVSKTLQMVEGHEFEEVFAVDDNIQVTFLENGHLYGSALILISAKFKKEELNILFTGDYNPNNFFFTPKKLPYYVKNLKNLIIVQESTYGSDERKEAYGDFYNDIPEILNSGKSILIPCIAQERYEIILANLKNLQQDGKISLNIPIYSDSPLAHSYLEKYKKAYGTDFIPYGLEFVEPAMRNVITTTSEQKIIISASGMCTNGPSELYLSQIISKDNWAVYFTCYQAEETFGRKLIEFYNLLDSKKKKVDKKLRKNVSDYEKSKLEDSLKFEVNGTKNELKVSVYSTSEFSSHARQEELIDFLYKFNNISAILINHGEEDTKQAYKSKLKELKIAENIDIISREKYFVLNKDGIISKNNTKFLMKEIQVKEKHTSSFKKKTNKDRTKTRYPRTKIRIYQSASHSYQIY